MSDIAIRVEGLSKLYRIGAKQARYRTLRESLTDAVAAPFRRFSHNGNSGSDGGPNSIWALKDVSFEVKRGEVLGIIGRNGAGKSTLLKILSRITDPTSGFAELHGRVGSLLEVGTGFHPELTGRENIYLSGAILGMKREEIDRKFDEIVDFAEIDKFVDTPVKQFSSGMYLRLAFAVAAHLEPEILLVDEVLAVGDARFQQQCLNKMESVASHGRTIIFVSHNLSSIRRLCSSALVVRDGTTKQSGDPAAVIEDYLTDGDSGLSSTGRNLRDRNIIRGGSGAVLFTEFVAGTSSDGMLHPIRTGTRVRMELHYRSTTQQRVRDMLVAINVRDLSGNPVTSLGNRYTGQSLTDLPPIGCIVCEIEKFPLMPGRYSIDLVCRADGEVTDKLNQAATIIVQEGDFYNTSALPPRVVATVAIEHSFVSLG